MIPLRYNLAAALLTAGLGIGLFASAHALFIVPIWSRLGFGIPFAVGAALAIAWAHHALLRAGRLALRWRDGLLFGIGVWFLLLPATLLGMAARLTGWHARGENLEITLEVLVTGVTGAILGWRLGGWRCGVSGAVAALAILAAIGGPVPITVGRRALEIWGSLLLVLASAGVFHTLLLGRMAPRVA